MKNSFEKRAIQHIRRNIWREETIWKT